MVTEEKYMQLNDENIMEMLEFARTLGMNGVGTISLYSRNFITFNEYTKNDRDILNVDDYLVWLGADNILILTALEFLELDKPDVVMEYERLLNILLPVLYDGADVYGIIGDILGVEIIGLDVKMLSIDGYHCKCSLEPENDADNNLVYRVNVIND